MLLLKRLLSKVWNMTLDFTLYCLNTESLNTFTFLLAYYQNSTVFGLKSCTGFLTGFSFYVPYIRLKTKAGVAPEVYLCCGWHSSWLSAPLTRRACLPNLKILCTLVCTIGGCWAKSRGGLTSVTLWGPLGISIGAGFGFRELESEKEPTIKSRGMRGRLEERGLQ